MLFFTLNAHFSAREIFCSRNNASFEKEFHPNRHAIGCFFEELVANGNLRQEGGMHDVKDTLRALVRIGFDGRVHKTFRGPKAEERFANEVRVLRFLEKQDCPFVPRLLEAKEDQLKIVTTSCGQRVDHLDDERMKELYAELETYGVRHDDAELRNVTYRRADGRFCLIDFEFATILPDFQPKTHDSAQPDAADA